jgi:hypothetical protein
MALDAIDADTRLYELQGGRLHLGLVEPGFERHCEATEFIARAYNRVFGASLRSFYPSLITLREDGQRLCGVAGARHAEAQQMFLEQYLDQPAESAIAKRIGRAIPRQGIVEIGNLSVARPALTYPFMAMIGGWLQAYEVDWLVFALTHTLRCLFQRAGVELIDLGAAEPRRLGQTENDWGSYYDHEPRVTAVCLTRGLAHFRLRHGNRERRNTRSRDVPEAAACEA